MLAKNITGIIILILNVGGLCFVFVSSFIAIKNKFMLKNVSKKTVKPLKKKKTIKKVAIKEDQDEIMNDMDLSDFDDLNFDDSD